MNTSIFVYKKRNIEVNKIQKFEPYLNIILILYQYI